MLECEAIGKSKEGDEGGIICHGAAHLRKDLIHFSPLVPNLTPLLLFNIVNKLF
jgi:hypothetical protein